MDTSAKRFSGKVAFITGAGRGQGRAHAIGLAREGARIIALDVPRPTSVPHYSMATGQDLARTAELVKEVGGEILTFEGDVRDRSSIDAALTAGMERFGSIDIVIPNAAVCSVANTWEIKSDELQDLIDVNIIGVYNTVALAIPGMIKAGKGGSIIMISSIGGLRGLSGIGHYVATKHAVIGLMRSLANDLGVYNIRVNAVCPTNVHTDMLNNEASFALFRPDLEHPTFDDAVDGMASMHLLKEPWLEPTQITEAVMFLASDSGSAITGVTLPVDLGMTARTLTV